MAGHSKWANIKHKKSREDAKRGKVFTKIGRLIAVAVKEGGTNPETNSKLSDAVAKAKTANMPNDNIERSIKKAAGELGNVQYEEIIYEGYGPEGAAVIVEAMTDNRNRTAGEVRYIFDKSGGNLGETGCVAWMFDRKGVLIVEKEEGMDEEQLMLYALEAGAEDFVEEEEIFEITTDVSDFSKVRREMEEKGVKFASAQVEMIPKTTIELTDDNKGKMLQMIDKLEDHDDVQNIYYNCDVEV